MSYRSGCRRCRAATENPTGTTSLEETSLVVMVTALATPLAPLVQLLASTGVVVSTLV